MARVVAENFVRRHVADCLGNAGIHKVNDLSAPENVHQRDDDEPYKETSAADDECVFQADDIAETEDGCACVELQYNFGLVRHVLSCLHHCRGYRFAPRSECRDDEIVETADETA